MFVEDNGGPFGPGSIVQQRPGITKGMAGAGGFTRTRAKFEGSPLNHIHAGQAEMACRTEQPNVIGVDLFEAVFGRTRQVERIGCAQEDVGRKRGVHTREPGNDRLGKSQPSKCAQFAFAVELAKQGAQVAAGNGSLSKFAMERRDGLCSSVDAADQLIRLGQRTYLFPARVLEIQARDVAGIKVDHASDSFRSSEIPTVLSVPRDSFPVEVSLRKAGRSTRRVK